MKKRFLSLLLALLMISSFETVSASENSEADTVLSSKNESSAAQTEENLREIKKIGSCPDDNYRTWYEIFVYSFCDSNGDGIGDLQGVISKLDYLQDLGISGIWLMPVHPSSSYHKYDVEDYYAIDPAYGTLADFDELIKQCSSRNIRVIVDLVLNHSSDKHPWFQKASEYLSSLKQGQEPDISDCPYAGYYNFKRADFCPSSYHLVPGTKNWYYEGRFSPNMPDLNLDSEEVRNSMKNIMAFWLNRGVSGFRLDAAKEFYTGQTSKNLEVLSWIQTTAKSIRPDCYLVAEVWDSFMTLTEYYSSGIDSLFNFAFGSSSGKIVKVLRAAGNPSMVSSYAVAQQKADTSFRKRNPDYMDAPFLSNHDVGRCAGFVGRDANKTKLAAAMNLFMSGNTFIYYGEEIGMVAGALNDPSYRAPMYWSSDKKEGIPLPPPGCVIPENYPFGSLEEQKNKDDSVYSYYRQAIAVRNAVPAIARGVPTAESALNAGCISACRKMWENESCIILMNISDVSQTVSMDGYEQWNLTAKLSANGEIIEMTDGKLYLPPFAAAVITEN